MTKQIDGKKNFPVSLPSDLYTKLKNKSQDGRPMNWHAVKALEAYLKKD